VAQIVIISGPPGAGKSSVCRALCDRYDRTVHLETDVLYGAIKMGFVQPWLAASSRQNHMVSRAAARAATAYAQDLYAVFIDGVIGPHLLPDYVEELRVAQTPVHLAVLLPSLESVVERGIAREDRIRVPEDRLREGHAKWREWSRDAVFARCTIDNSAMSAEQAADVVMDACGRGELLVYSPE
jgi:chloramphenicol 3-O-phosphotransferase